MVSVQAIERPLGPTAKAVLEYIKTFIAANEMPPTLREIAAGCGIKSTATVHYQLDKLERHGLIRVVENRARGLQIVNPQ